MSALKFLLRVQWEDDEQTVDVPADQRDVAAFEMQPFGAGYSDAITNKLQTFMRFMAWNSMRRRRETRLAWPAWNDKVVEVAEISSDAEQADDVDPTQPGPSGAP